MPSAKRQKNDSDEEAEQEDGLESSIKLMSSAVAESAFPHIEVLQHLLLRYLVYKAFDPPRSRSANTLDDAQFMWDRYVEWCKVMGRSYVGTYQGLQVERSDRLLEGEERTAAVLWVSQGGGHDTCLRIETDRLTHVAIVASCATSALAAAFTNWADLYFLSKLTSLQEVVLVLPGLQDVGEGWLSHNPQLSNVHFEGMTDLARVGRNWLRNCAMLEAVDFGGLGKLAGVRSGWLVECHRLLTADFSGLESLNIVEWNMFGRLMGGGPVGWLSEADRPQPPSLRLPDGSLQTHRWLLMWNEKCPKIREIRLRHYGTFKKSSQGDWSVSEVDPLAYNW
jgi:hypothetical protein